MFSETSQLARTERGPIRENCPAVPTARKLIHCVTLNFTRLGDTRCSGNLCATSARASAEIINMNECVREILAPWRKVSSAALRVVGCIGRLCFAESYFGRPALYHPPLFFLVRSFFFFGDAVPRSYLYARCRLKYL